MLTQDVLAASTEPVPHALHGCTAHLNPALTWAILLLPATKKLAISTAMARGGSTRGHCRLQRILQLESGEHFAA